MKKPDFSKLLNLKELSIHILATMGTFFLLVASGASAIFVLLLLRMLNETWYITMAPTTLLCMAMVISTIIGTSVGLLLSKALFKPVDNIINLQKKVAKGDFSVRAGVPKGKTIVTDLVTGFNSMTEELGSTEIFRNDFINNFSHEFKTPIISIKGFANQLKDENLTHEQQQEYIDIIIKESERLASMSSGILLLTKFENQQMVTDKTTFYLDEHIRKSILLLEKEWSGKNINLDFELNELEFYGNEEMLSHVWLNIIGNAVKFTPENGRITIKCYRDGNNATVRIIDTGIGMDDKTQRHIFDKFYQGDESHSSGGNGLGLPLVKRVVTLCGGKISVKSQKGRGTTFVVRLPFERE